MTKRKYENTQRRTTRTVMYEVLAEHPTGVTASKLFLLCLGRWATDKSNIAVLLSQDASVGKVQRLGHKTCEHCGHNAMQYGLKKEHVPVTNLEGTL